MDVAKHLRLTQAGAMKIVDAAVTKALEMKKPQCIAVVDEGGHLLAFMRMDGAKRLSIESSIRKASTAAQSAASASDRKQVKRTSKSPRPGLRRSRAQHPSDRLRATESDAERGLRVAHE